MPYWWFHGTVEAGGRFFLNDPSRNGSIYLGQDSLAKYYEYSRIKPGPFSNVVMSTGSKDGLYQVDLGGQNIGYNDQSYYLDWSKAGEQYISLSWDQTPHLYSTSAQTPYLGVGSNALTLPLGLTNAINKTAFTAATGANLLNPFLNQTDIGIERDTASIGYRWTPSEPWDFKADYSYMRRTGTQIDGVVGLSTGSNGGSGAGSIQVPKPVSDSTQNYGVNGEYAGTSFWGQRFTFKLAYSGSQYVDDYSSYTVQSPFCTNPTACATTSTMPVAQMSLWPSNQANSYGGTFAADLPMQSRYVGTVNYSMMTQDSAFIPMTGNPIKNTFGLPASSLNGDINTLLVNNVMNTKINSDLTAKTTYRYYYFNNDTPQILFNKWIRLDCPSTGCPSGSPFEGAQSSLQISYAKQNAGEELNWRPSRDWNLGVAYGYEHYDWWQADVTATNENSGKLYADWKPTGWLTVRSSGYYSNRRYDNYNALANVGTIQEVANLQVNPAYRQFMFSNRERWQANFAVDLVAFHGVTISPTLKYKDDHYGLDPTNQMGLTDSQSWSPGVDITYVINPRASVMAGYMWDHYAQLLYSFNSTSATAQMTPQNFMHISDRAGINTLVTAATYEAIPDKLNFDVRYSLSKSVDSLQMFIGNGGPTPNGQFPDVTDWFQRFDATATYKFDKQAVAQIGGKGELKAKLRYVWERNSADNWQQEVSPFSPSFSTNSIYLASDNPNYNAHMLMASLLYTW